MFLKRCHLVSQIKHWVAAGTGWDSPWNTEFGRNITCWAVYLGSISPVGQYIWAEYHLLHSERLHAPHTVVDVWCEVNVLIRISQLLILNTALL